ncbi:MAG: maleylacetoacetate isomerase [Rhodanobacter sp.]
MTEDLVLYSYWRSSAAYRVRIALNLKGLKYTYRSVHLLQDGGQQHSPDYRLINPQELVPTLCDGERTFTQSLAIMEYLDETRPGPPLLPTDARGRAQVREWALLIACDIHPLGNLRVLQYLESDYAADAEKRALWSRHWMAMGFCALEEALLTSPATGRFCYGDTPGIADACLVPQYYNALRWKLPLNDYPTLQRIYAECIKLEPFQRAAPEVQPDAHATD